LEELSTAIRMRVEGEHAPALTRAIEGLPNKTKGQAKRLKQRLDYWSMGLLLEDLKSIQHPDQQTSARIAELEAQRKIFHAVLCRSAVLKRVLLDGELKLVHKFEPLKDIDQESPFR